MWRLGESPSRCVSSFGHLYFFDTCGRQVMKYNAKDNVWRAQDGILESLLVDDDDGIPMEIDHSCAAVWHGRLFFTHSPSSTSVDDQVFYIFHPKPNGGRWIALGRTHKFQGFVHSLLSLYI
eukprot:Gb_24040 [translate_table: standard]